MWKKQKRWKKSSSKLKRKNDRIVSTFELKNTEPVVLETCERHDSFLAQLAKNPRFVGAMRMMLIGCFACGAFISILFAYPDLGRLFEKTTYDITFFIPNTLIPPKTFIPGIFMPPLMLLIVAGFTFYGYRTGSEPLDIKTEHDSRSIKEKLLGFFFLSAGGLLFGLFTVKDRSSETNFYDTVWNPMFIIFSIIITVAVFYLTFSRHQSQKFLIFVIYSAIACGFVLVLLGLIFYTIVEFWLHILNR